MNGPTFRWWEYVLVAGMTGAGTTALLILAYVCWLVF